VIPNLLTAVGDIAAVHQVKCPIEAGGRIHRLMFRGYTVKDGSPWCNVDGPKRAIWQVSRRRATVAQLATGIAARACIASVWPANHGLNSRGGYAQANAGITRQSDFSQKLVRRAVHGELGGPSRRGRPGTHRRHAEIVT